MINFRALMIPFLMSTLPIFFMEILRVGFKLWEKSFAITAIIFVLASLIIANIYELKLNQSKIRKQIDIGLFLVGLALVGLTGLHYLSEFVFQKPFLAWNENFYFYDFSSFRKWSWFLFVTILLGPFYEEIYFRALTLQTVDHFTGSTKKILSRTSAILSFTLAHLLVREFSLIMTGVWLCCGVLNTFLYDYFKGYWAGFVVHGSANLILFLFFM